ncbi:hypothetical protein GXY_00449 [Novacetimonas hansenii ATCC 23769]|uniref:Uncharacterized protein n=1 Tax=Novacetimonas hansenii ATCC 23769 TaxID=714995 RepID=D5QAF5_NOVHA|nr:hypothetical protein GXY_00449 [Novacetimonas hansenii ATCC 23769]
MVSGVFVHVFMHRDMFRCDMTEGRCMHVHHGLIRCLDYRGEAAMSGTLEVPAY